jgi:Peptidase family M28
VIDFRIYRAAFLPALVAIVVLLFALQTPPDPLPAVVAPAEFDQVSAAKIARRIVAGAPVRPPGSEGDAAVADMVEKQFKGVPEAQVAEQRFGGTFAGKDVQLRNVIMTLPGESPRSVVLLASRDSARGPGSASSAAATATLMELVNQLRTSTHSKTLIFVSTDGGSDGAAGARQWADQFPERDLIDGVIVLSQPGSANPRQPFLLDASDGPQSANAGFVRTAQRALTDQTGSKPQGEGIFGELARLALPSGLGEQAVLIERGINAVGLSSAGERPLPVARDQPADLSASTLGDFGRTALVLASTLDSAPAPPEHGPDAYVTLAGNLVPGWTLALLALTLVLPGAVASLHGLGRALKRRAPIGEAIAWAASRALPPLASLLLLYVMAATGIIVRPTFPFDPNLLRVGVGQIIAMAFLAIVVLAGYYAIRAWRVPAGLPREAAAPALGVVSALAVLIAWLANPYLALLLVPVAHVWLLDARRGGALPWPAVLVGAAVSVLPSAAAVDHVVERLSLGSAAPWQLLLMVGEGQIGFGEMFALCLLIGSLVGIVALAIRRPAARPRPQPASHHVRTATLEQEPASTSRHDLDASPIGRGGVGDDLGDGRRTA